VKMGFGTEFGTGLEQIDESAPNALRSLARRKGFEPLTPRFEVWCSIQLSYRRLRGTALPQFVVAANSFRHSHAQGWRLRCPERSGAPL
jgi:hypothetical protein